MAQQFDYPRTETQLREIQDKLYQHSREARDAGDHPAFKGLLERLIRLHQKGMEVAKGIVLYPWQMDIVLPAHR